MRAKITVSDAALDLIEWTKIFYSDLVWFFLSHKWLSYLNIGAVFIVSTTSVQISNLDELEYHKHLDVGLW